MSSTAPSPNSSPSLVPPASMSSPPPPSSPNSSPSAVPPASVSSPLPPSSNPTASPPPQPSSTPPPTPSTSSPSSQPNADPPDSSNSTTQSPPPRSPPPPVTALPPPPQPPSSGTSPPLAPNSSPPPNPRPSPIVPPPSRPPPTNSNPPASPPPPPPPSSRPPVSSPPPPTAKPPANSPPPPSSKPPETSPPPPPASVPPTSSPPPPASVPPRNSPPPPASLSPQSSPPPPPASVPPPTSSAPPPASVPPKNSPPPPASLSPQNSPPRPPASVPPKSSPPPPASIPPKNSPPRLTPVPPTSQPIPSPTNSTSRSSPPPSKSQLAPPPVPTNNSSPNATENTNSNGGNGGNGTAAAVAIAVVVGIVVLTLVGLVVWCFRRQRKKESRLGGYIMPSPLGSSPRSDSSHVKTHSSAPLVRNVSGSDYVYSSAEQGGLGNSRSWFSFEELAKATNGFSAHNLLGEGGFGSVYRGCLPDGREIAVKQLKIGGGQGEREFKAEVEIISRIHHRHLVSLVGYCISENRRLLVYDYVPNNTLYYHLHGEGQPVLDWATRVKIAAGSARGLAYLHEDCHPRIIHRDIKSSNILLDNNFEARVSDFGLAKLALDANTHITTRVMGTFGYVAPEYASSGKLTEKSDVYSFGVVLLELITGRKPVDASQPLGDESLVEWARPLLSHALDSEEFEGLVDPRLEKNYVESEMLQLIGIAAACVRHSSAKRPRMGQVVRAFDGLATSDLTNGMRVGESEVFNSAQQSEEIRWFRRVAFGSQDFSTDFFSQGSSNG